MGGSILKAHRAALAIAALATLCAVASLLLPPETSRLVVDALTGVMAIAVMLPCLTLLALRPRRVSAVLGSGIAFLLAALALQKFFGPAGVPMIDLLQLLMLDLAYGAILAVLLLQRAARIEHGQDPAAVGDLARFLFVYAGYFDRLRYPDFKRRTRLPLARQVIFVVHFLRWLPQHAPHVRRLTGRGSLRQTIDIVALQVRHDLDAQAYYMFELYRPERLSEAAGYVTRFETKNGLVYRLNALFERRRPDGRSWLGDKIRFADMCAELGIRCVPVLARIEAGALLWAKDADRNLRHDFFVKRRIGKGALGAGLYRILPNGRHRAPSGAEAETEILLAELARSSRAMKQPSGAGEGALLPAQERAANKRALLIQPRLRNHPAIADMAEESLMVVRVITCLGMDAGVVVAYAMLRILGVLEPRWQTKVEFAAPIDLATGTLGHMTGDKGETVTRRFDTHPVLTGVTIAGRGVPHFQQIIAEVTAAHRAFADRFIIGWDVAITPDGPLIVEGNAHPDLEFPQRVHGRPIAASPMGPLLHRHLMRLERSEPLLALTRTL